MVIRTMFLSKEGRGVDSKKYVQYVYYVLCMYYVCIMYVLCMYFINLYILCTYKKRIKYVF